MFTATANFRDTNMPSVHVECATHDAAMAEVRALFGRFAALRSLYIDERSNVRICRHVFQPTEAGPQYLFTAPLT